MEELSRQKYNEIFLNTRNQVAGYSSRFTELYLHSVKLHLNISLARNPNLTTSQERRVMMSG